MTSLASLRSRSCTRAPLREVCELHTLPPCLLRITSSPVCSSLSTPPSALPPVWVCQIVPRTLRIYRFPYFPNTSVVCRSDEVSRWPLCSTCPDPSVEGACG